jgi:hypothetical protein
MESISLKLPEVRLEASDRGAKALGIPRAEYIRRALERMARASCKVRRESMRVNAEFAKIERVPDG